MAHYLQYFLPKVNIVFVYIMQMDTDNTINQVSNTDPIDHYAAQLCHYAKKYREEVCKLRKMVEYAKTTESSLTKKEEYDYECAFENAELAERKFTRIIDEIKDCIPALQTK